MWPFWLKTQFTFAHRFECALVRRFCPLPLVEVEEEIFRKVSTNMAENTNINNVTPQGNPPTVEVPDQPMPLVTAPSQPEIRMNSPISGSNYDIVRGSAASVEPPTTAVATRPKKRDQSVLDREKRGASSPPSAKARSRVEDAESPRKSAETSGQIMQLQNQVRALHDRLMKLETTMGMMPSGHSLASWSVKMRVWTTASMRSRARARPQKLRRQRIWPRSRAPSGAAMWPWRS